VCLTGSESSCRPQSPPPSHRRPAADNNRLIYTVCVHVCACARVCVCEDLLFIFVSSHVNSSLIPAAETQGLDSFWTRLSSGLDPFWARLSSGSDPFWTRLSSGSDPFWARLSSGFGACCGPQKIQVWIIPGGFLNQHLRADVGRVWAKLLVRPG